MKKKRPVVKGNRYDTTAMYWAVMYNPFGRSKPYIVTLYTRYSEAKSHMRRSNNQWEKNGWKPAFTVQRFMLYFRGNEVDMYEHRWERVEKKPKKI